MSTITVRKTKKAENLIVENQVAVAGTSLDAQLDVVEAASKVTVITGSTKPAAEVTASNATIAGRAGNATVKQVAAGINSVVNSNNTITLSAVKVSGNVYGGALVLDAKGKIANRGDIGSAVVNGSTAINLNNVISVKSVFGGGAGYGAVSNGDVTINYNGGKVSTIYGGGDRADVHGNVNINISAGTNGKVSKIYAGGKNSNVFGKATVTFSGNGGLYNNFSGTVYGTGQKGYITGGSELVFDDYSGEFKGSVQAFNTVTISGSSNVIFTKSQHKTMKGAQYVFVVEQGHASPMLTWNKKVQYANITVKVATEDAVDVVLIQSKYFKKDADFSTDWITVTNDEGETLSKHAYELIYNSAYEWQVNAKGKGKWVKVRDHGTVSISYKGTNATFNGEEEERVVLSGADDKINVTGNLKGGLSTAGGDDFIALHEGAKVSGGIDAGSGDDTLHVQKNVELNGVVSMGEGNDKVYVEEAAKVTSNIELGAGANELTVQKDASVTGTVVLEDGSSNVIRVNGGAISSITGKAESNEIHLNGTITGGGIGYWTALKAVTTVTGGYQITLPDGTQAFVPGEYVSNENPNSIFVTGNLDLRNADSNDKVYVNQYAAVNSIYLGSGDDYLEIANGAFVGHSYVSFGNAVDGGQAITGTIDLGSGSNTLVLKGDVAAAITSDVNAVNTIVLAGSITIDSNKFLTGRTGNVLIVSDGVEAIFNYTTVGAFLDGDKLFKGVYLSQNAMLSVNGDKLIQNFVGAVRSEGSIYVLDAADDGFVNDYYTKRSNGVESSRLDAQNVIVRKGAKISGSEINAAAVRLEDGATLTGGTVNAEITIMKGALVDGATLKGKVTLEKGGEIAGNTVIDAESAEVTLAGIVSAGTKINARDVVINSLDALPSEITAGTVKIIVDNYVNESLVIDFKDTLKLDVKNAVIGNLLINGKQYGKEFLKEDIAINGSLTISALSWIIVSNSDGNKEFADSYTVEIRGTLKGNAAFSNNTIYVSGLNPKKLKPSITGDITGSGKFVITRGVKTFFDYGQFTDGIDGFTFDIEANSLLTFDGVVSDEQKDQLINEKVNFLEDNAMFAIGKQAVIQNWTGSFDFATDLKNQLLSDEVLKFTDLYVKKNGKVFGAIKGDDANNELELGEGVKVNGSRKHYDSATINMQSGNDALIMNNGVEVNGSIDMGEGNDTIDMLGNVKINATVNQKEERPTVSMGEGNDTLNVEGSGNAIAGTLNLSAGENTVNIKADGDLAIQDLKTEGAAKTVLNIDGTLKVDAEALVFKAGTTEINIGENGKITDAEGNTVAAISMQSADANKLYNKGVLETDLEMRGNSNLIDNFNSFTATDVLDMNGGVEDDPEIVYEAAGENTIENHDAFSAEAGINMFGDANKIDSKTGKFTAGDVVMAGTKTVENDTLHEKGKTLFTQAGSNILINRDAENVMELGSLDMKGANNSINVANDEEDAFAKGTISADAVTMESTGNNTVKGTLNVNGDLRMSGAEGENQTISGSNKNEIDGTVTADSITMFGATNTVKGQVEAGNGILMAGGQKVEDGKIVYDKATLNTIDLDMAGSVSAEYASIEMHGNSNVIKSNAAQVIVDRSKENSEESGEIEDINAKISSKDGIVMEGGSNSLDFSVSAVAKGEYTTDKHDHAEITVGNVNLTVESDITMNGDKNELNLGYTLDANGEANITAGNADITVTGDIVMEGAENTLDLAITLNSANQSKVEAGALKLAYTGNISMTGKDAVNKLTLGVIANDLPDVDSHEPTYSERNVESAEVSVTGDIVMGGENATNTLTVGKNTTVTGSITMGDYDRDTATKENRLTLDVESAANITSIKLLADKNTVTFEGKGTVGDNFSVQGRDNTVTVGKDVTVEKDMIFTDLYDEDGDGVDNGDLLLENEKNDVTVNGKVAGIDSSATSADDNFKVYGTAGNITTGNSKNGDVVTVGKGVLGEDDVKTDAVAGTVTMGSGEKLSDGSNTLNVNASSYTDADDNTTEYSATVGEVKLYSKVGNTVAINGGTKKAATTGAITMVSEAENSLTAMNNAVIGGDVSMTSATGNTLSVTGKASEDGKVPTTPEEIGYGTKAIQAKINGSVTMTSSNGSNTAELIDAALEKDISMTAEKEDAKKADNTLTIAGSSYANKVWNAEKSEYKDDTVQQLATVSGAVSMTAADSNTLNAELATISGKVTMTANNGSNTIQGNGDDTASVITLPSLEMTAKVNNIAKFEDSAINGTVAMTAKGDNTLTLTRTNSGKVTMTADRKNTMSVYGNFKKAEEEAEVPSYTRYTVDGIDMTGTNNALNVGSTANLGIVSLGAVNMSAKGNNTMNVVAGPEFDYVKGEESTKIDATAQADSITMAGAQGTNALNVNQGTLKVGTIAMSNTDKDGNTGVDSANAITIADKALLVAKAITMGSANVTPDVTETAAGKYDDVEEYDIVKNADGSETYVYVWKDGETSTTPGDSLFTKTNTLNVNGKITATTVTMIGKENTLTISGPAKNDPNGHAVNKNYDETIARGTFTDVEMFGMTNTIAVGNTEAYKSAFNAASVTMGDIVLTAKDGKEVKVLAKENEINVAANTFFNVAGDITMTATDKNTVAIGDYSNRFDSKTESVWITAAGDATGDNYFNYEAVQNEIGGSIVASGAANTVTLGKNSVVNGGLDLTGDSNEVTLNAEYKPTGWEVNEDGKAVMIVVKADGTSVKMTEAEFNAYRDELTAKADKTEAETAWLAEYTVFQQHSDEFIVDAGAVVKGDIAFKLATKEYDTVPAEAPVNTLTLGKGTHVGGSVISTDTYTYVDADETVTSGANDTIVMDENSVIAGSVDLGYGNDSVTMTNAAIGGSVALGAGNDSVTVNGNAIIGGIDFGASDGDFNWTERTGYDYLDISGVLTVNGNITYSGNLVVNGEVKFADGFGFVADGDNAQLYYQNVTVENGTIEDPVELLGNLTLKGTVSVNAAISAYDDADVEFNNYPAGDINALTLADGAAVTLSDVNLGLGANTVTLGADASLTLDGALNANAKMYKVVDGENVYVNAAGQTDAELQAIYDAAKDAYDTELSAWESARDTWLAANAGKTEADYISETGNTKPVAPVRQEFVQGYAEGWVDMAMWNGSVLTVNKDVEVRSLNLTADAPAEETVFNYTIAGSAELTVTGSIGVEPDLNNVAANVTIDTAVTAEYLGLTGFADTVALNAEFTAKTLDMGAGNDVLNINAKFTAATLDMGAGDDVLNINSAGSDISTISNAETVNISADTTLKTVTGSTRIVVKSGTASITAEGGIVSYEVQGGTLNGALSRDIQVVENASLSGSSTGTITVAEGKSIALSNGYSATAINGTAGGAAETVTGTNITVLEANNVSFDVTGTLTLTGTSYAAEFEVANATIKFSNTASFDSSAWTGAKYDFSAQTTAVTDTATISDVADWGALFGKFSVDLNTTTDFYSNASLSGVSLDQLAGRADNTVEGSITLGTTTFTAAAGSDDFVNNGKKLALTGTTLGIASV